MTPRNQNVLLIAGFALLAVLAVAGWTRTPGAQAAPAMANQFTGQQPNAYDPNAVPANSAGYAPAGYAAGNCLEPGQMQPVSYTESGYRTSSRPRVIRYVEEPQPVVRREYVEGDRARTEVVTTRRRGRSTGKSVAIVGGSAGVGAAIGALAGGGKGAAIGALTGGGAGFVYDRLTHNK